LKQNTIDKVNILFYYLGCFHSKKGLYTMLSTWRLFSATIAFFCLAMNSLANSQPMPDSCSLVISGPVTEETSKKFFDEFYGRCSSNAQLHVTIMSSGGDPDIGSALHDFLRGHEAHTHVIGKAYSAAVSIFLGGIHRTIAPNALLLIHPGTMGLGGDLTEREVDEMVRLYREQDRIYNAIIAGASNMEQEATKKLVDAHTILTAEEAVRLGFAHAIAWK